MPPYAEEIAWEGKERSGRGWDSDLLEVEMDLVKSAQSVEEFRPIRALGHGDMGTVFLVMHIRSGKPVAMKVIDKEMMQKKKSFKRAWMEREILSRLDHPFLPKLFTKFDSRNYSYLLMSYCSGGDLNVLRHMQHNQRFSESAARFYAAEVVLALEYLHQHGIVYRDLKPENILVQANGHVMLTDFDLSLIINNNSNSPKPSKSCSDNQKKSKTKTSSSWRLLAKLNPIGAKTCIDSTQKGNMSESSNTRDKKTTNYRWMDKENKRKSLYEQSHSFAGTEEYVAPEVLWGTGHGFAVDWWAFGILLYEMVHGKTPFKGSIRTDTFFNVLCKEPESLGPPWSPLKDLLKRLLVKDPSKRLGSNHGAQEIRNHEFFEGIMWDELEYVSRPPFVPPPFSIDKSQGVHDNNNAKMKEKLETF